MLRLLHSLELPLHLPLLVLDGRLELVRIGLLNQHRLPTTGELLMPSQLSNGKFLTRPKKKLVILHSGYGQGSTWSVLMKERYS